MFATHYHRLADDHAGDSNVSVRHMACHVDTSGDIEQVPAAMHAGPIAVQVT